LVRTVAKVSGWAYSLTEQGVVVNLYGGNTFRSQLKDGSQVALLQTTNYPWEGFVRLTVDKGGSAPWEIRLRIPGWAAGASIAINGTRVKEAVVPGTYHALTRSWKAGDVIDLDFPMEVRLLEGHPRIEEIRNQVAVKRGPVVYCLESPDLPEGTSILDVYLPAEQTWTPVYQPDFLGGLTTIGAEVLLRKHATNGMYHAVGSPNWKRVSTSFTPYYAWSNRGRSEMTVWLPVRWGNL
jgi:DUF1680 family protein